MQQSEWGTVGAGNKCSSTKKLEALILMRAETEKGTEKRGREETEKQSTEGEEQKAQRGKSRRHRRGRAGGQIRAAGRFNLTVARIQFSCHHVAD